MNKVLLLGNCGLALGLGSFNVQAPKYRGEEASPFLPMTDARMLSNENRRYEQVGLTFDTTDENPGNQHQYWVNFVDTSLTNFKKTAMVSYWKADSHIGKKEKRSGKCKMYAALNWSNPFLVEPFSWANQKEFDYRDIDSYYTSPLICNVAIQVECNTKYIYSIGTDSQTYEFKTPVCEGDQEITVAVVADLGQTEDSAITMSHLEESIDAGANLLIFPGDLSYSDGFQPRWDTYGKLAEKTFGTKVGAIYSNGNHDIADGEVNVRYNMQYNPSGDLFSSYNVGPLHVISLSSYTAFNNTPYEKSLQYSWLEHDLEEANKNREHRPWIVAFWHTPWYNSNEAHFEEGEKMRHQMEDLLHSQGVDLVFAGHVHAYERSHPSYNLKPTPENPDGSNCGTTYITIGDGGNREGPASLYLDSYHAPYRAYCEASFGHGKFTIKNATHLEWSWLRNRGPGMPAELGDHVVIHRPQNRHLCKDA